MASEVDTVAGDPGRGLRGLLLAWLMRALSLSWLTGPIFNKELRVSSRRRRNYVLRSLYIALFMLLLAMFWMSVVSRSTSSVYQASRMAMAGQVLIFAVVWFQFIAIQVVAVVMLSTSISEEIYGRTLGVLMTTPIGSLQIVLGKLLSRLLQLVLLLAITLPMLAVVRVFGGVPWDYLVCSLCVTLTTVLFLGSLSLFFSIFTRRAYTVIITTVLVAALLFAVVPLILAFTIHRIGYQAAFLTWLTYVNPYVVMMRASEAIASVRSTPSVNWAIHCGVALLASALLLLSATALVRRAALRQATGQSGLWSRKVRPKSPAKTARARRVRRVTGSPVLWKERRTPLLGRRRLGVTIAGLGAIGLIGTTYALCAREDILTEGEVHAAYVVVFLGVGTLFTAVLPATCITAEKESQTWPLLLTTTVGNWEILWGKLLGAARRCLPAWLFLFGHVVLFAMAGLIHPVAIVQLGILAAWIVFFLSGTGLYFSLHLRHTTTAVIANVALAAGLWIIVPLLMGLVLAATHGSEALLMAYMDANPAVEAAVITLATARNGGLGAYDWLQSGMADVGPATGWILLTFGIYTVAGLGFIARTGSRLRRNPLGI
jgi:ABC-2 type transport system permease protein